MNKYTLAKQKTLSELCCKFEAEIADLKEKLRVHQLWLEQERDQKKVSGIVLSAALRGDTHPKEPPNDGRLVAVRGLVNGIEELRAENESLKKALVDSCDELISYLNEEYPDFKREYPRYKARYESELEEIIERLKLTQKQEG